MNKRFEGILNKMSRNKKKRNNEKIIIIILVQNLKWATAHLSRRQSAGRAGARLGARAHVGHRRQADASTGAGARGARQQTTRALGGVAALRRGARARGAGRHEHAAGRRGVRGVRQGPRSGRAAGLVGCALGALSLFLAWFDSLWFLSRFLDIVREPGS